MCLIMLIPYIPKFQFKAEYRDIEFVLLVDDVTVSGEVVPSHYGLKKLGSEPRGGGTP